MAVELTSSALVFVVDSTLIFDVWYGIVAISGNRGKLYKLWRREETTIDGSILFAFVVALVRCCAHLLGGSIAPDKCWWVVVSGIDESNQRSCNAHLRFYFTQNILSCLLEQVTTLYNRKKFKDVNLRIIIARQKCYACEQDSVVKGTPLLSNAVWLLWVRAYLIKLTDSIYNSFYQ